MFEDSLIHSAFTKLDHIKTRMAELEHDIVPAELFNQFEEIKSTISTLQLNNKSLENKLKFLTSKQRSEHEEHEEDTSQLMYRIHELNEEKERLQAELSHFDFCNACNQPLRY